MNDLLEDVIFELSDEVKRAEYDGEDYLDCVRVQMMRDALTLLKEQQSAYERGKRDGVNQYLREREEDEEWEWD